MEGFLRAAQAGEITAPALASLVWDTVRWPLLALLLGFTALGLLGCHFCLRYGDFCWPFRLPHLCACSAARAVCWPLGLWGERCAFGAGAVCAWGAGPPAARVLAGRAGGWENPSALWELYFFRCGACAVALCVSLLLDCFVVPGLVSSLAGTFLSL